MTQMTTSIAGVILIESGLSFLGLGPRGMVPTWGQLLSEGRTVIVEAPILAIAPGMSIFLVIFSANLVGDALRDRFDPQRHGMGRVKLKQ
jgi:peptide/nickel transport system permease protein